MWGGGVGCGVVGGVGGGGGGGGGGGFGGGLLKIYIYIYWGLIYIFIGFEMLCFKLWKGLELEYGGC